MSVLTVSTALRAYHGRYLASHAWMGEFVEEAWPGRGREADAETNDETAADEHAFFLCSALEGCANNAE